MAISREGSSLCKRIYLSNHKKAVKSCLLAKFILSEDPKNISIRENAFVGCNSLDKELLKKKYDYVESPANIDNNDNDNNNINEPDDDDDDNNNAANVSVPQNSNGSINNSNSNSDNNNDNNVSTISENAYSENATFRHFERRGHVIWLIKQTTPKCSKLGYSFNRKRSYSIRW